MNILITGAVGFLGQYVVDKFSKQDNINIYGISRRTPCKKNMYTMNITNHEEINRIVSEKSISHIVHLAGKPIVYDCEKNPFDAFMTNGIGTASVLEAARKNKVKRVISIETDKVYGVQENLPTTELAKPNPNSPYEFSKCLAANFADFYRNYYGLDVVSVRPANLYGPKDMSTSRLIPSALRNLKSGKGITVYLNAVGMERDFVYVEDVAEAIFLLTTTDKLNHAIYNISNNEPMEIEYLADTILRILDLNIKHEWIKKDTFNEIPKQRIDGTRFVEEFNFNFKSFEEGIKATWKSLHLEN